MACWAAGNSVKTDFKHNAAISRVDSCFSDKYVHKESTTVSTRLRRPWRVSRETLNQRDRVSSVGSLQFARAHVRFHRHVLHFTVRISKKLKHRGQNAPLKFFVANEGRGSRVGEVCGRRRRSDTRRQLRQKIIKTHVTEIGIQGSQL